MEDDAIGACAIEVPLESGAPASWAMLVPAGDIRARDGRRWRNSDPEAAVRRTRARAGGVDMAVDYEHQSEAKGAGPSPAAGWIQAVEVRDGAIWGRIAWTERAAAMLAAKEYRYISPSFMHDARTGVVKVLLKASLVQDPAIDMPALASRQRRNRRECDDMDDELKKRICKALGIAEDAGDEQIEAALAKAQAPGASLAKVALALGVAADAAADDIIAAAEAQAPDPASYVPRAEFDRLAAETKALQEAGAKAQAAAAVDEAVTAGKVAPGMREWALSYASGDLEGFKKYAEAAPAILSPGRAPAPAGGQGDDGLSDTERAVCRDMGIDPKDYVASRKSLRAEAA